MKIVLSQNTVIDNDVIKEWLKMNKQERSKSSLRTDGYWGHPSTIYPEAPYCNEVLSLYTDEYLWDKIKE
jgi:hypothetical protein